MTTDDNRRSLRLRRETLTEMTADELATVGGGQATVRQPTPIVKSLPLAQCLSLDCWNSEPCPGTSMC